MPVGAKTENSLGGGLVDGRERERPLCLSNSNVAIIFGPLGWLMWIVSLDTFEGVPG